MRLRTILVPTDFSASATAALAYAKVLATRLNARLHLLHVISEPYLFDAWGTEAIAGQIVGLEATLEREARKQLAALTPKSGPLAGRVTTSTTNGTTVEGILNCIAARRVDLVVLGTHGRGLVAHVLLGSVAERIVRHSPIPVLTVHGETARSRPKAAGKRRRPRRA